MIVQAKILDYDLDNGTMTIDWGNNIVLSHRIPDFFDENSTDGDIESYLMTQIPHSEIESRNEFLDRAETLIPRLEELKGQEFTLDLEIPEPQTMSGEGSTLPNAVEVKI